MFRLSSSTLFGWSAIDTSSSSGIVAGTEIHVFHARSSILYLICSELKPWERVFEVRKMEEEATSHSEQADPASRAARAGVQAGARDIDRLLKFKKLYPTEFEGTFKPQEVEDWLKMVERVLTAMGVTNEQKVTLATFTLKGQALIWWEESQRLLSAPLPGIQPPMPQVITWARFVKAFNDHYCPETYRFQQEAYFINLKQGSMSVAEYEAKFNALSAYATDMVDTEEKKGRRFRGGLEDNV
ncbi:uncharacterized protein LOC131306852 [Rhododendron vialii]|uniref:uncharacterized protein LOC131306852 n=1 Tax=Rhododendron vialii TaxID=182163 RepID=UPI00265F105A|nr:uncharacterized protein LOC131306852 [Rhododendron vialii]